jgi:hypothetical protein
VVLFELISLFFDYFLFTSCTSLALPASSDYLCTYLIHFTHFLPTESIYIAFCPHIAASCLLLLASTRESCVPFSFLPTFICNSYLLHTIYLPSEFSIRFYSLFTRFLFAFNLLSICFQSAFFLLSSCFLPAFFLLSSCFLPAIYLLSSCFLPAFFRLSFCFCLLSSCFLPAICLLSSCFLPAFFLLSFCFLPAFFLLSSCFLPAFFLLSSCFLPSAQPLFTLSARFLPAFYPLSAHYLHASSSLCTLSTLLHTFYPVSPALTRSLPGFTCKTPVVTSYDGSHTSNPVFCPTLPTRCRSGPSARSAR